MATTYTGWDAQMNFLLANNRGGPNYDRFGSGLRGNRTEIFPLLSRSNNIGMEVNLSKEWGMVRNSHAAIVSHSWSNSENHSLPQQTEG